MASLMAAASLLAASPTAAQFHLEDSLRGSTTGNATGGSFGAEGWTITGVSDQIWYALPTLTSGSVEFTVTNLTTAALPLADHEIFAMYEAGYGIGEPIRYNPEFRQNHYKILMRIYGMPEPDRLGAMKLMWGVCPSGAPGYNACGCGSFFEEPFGSRLEWTGAPVRIRVEWGAGRARLLRDGAEIVSVDYTGFVFGPSEMHMMIGSPRNDGGLSAMPMGATFSDLVVDGIMGSVAICPGMSDAGPAPDAGPLPDAGACGTTVAATADATAASFTSGVFPDPTDLNVEGDGTAPQAVVYVRFPPVTGPVSRATLTLDTSSGASSGGGSGQVCRVEAGAWDEATLTWATRPTVGMVCSGGARTVSPSSSVTWDVTSLVAPGGDVELAIVSTDADGAHYLSREAGGCASGPRLALEYAAGVDGGAIDLDAAVSATDDGGSGAVDARGATIDAGSRGIASGCGCRVGGSQWSRTGGLALVALVALALRRRRRPGA